MSGKWIAMFLNLYVVLILLCATQSTQNIPGLWPGTGTGGVVGNPAFTPVNTLGYLMNLGNAFQHLPVLGGLPLPWPNPQYFYALWQVLTLAPIAAMFNGTDFEIFYWFVEGICMMGVFALVSLVVGVVRGTLTWG